MGFGWLKTVGKVALAGVKLAGPALPGGGFITKLLPFVIKGATGLHNVSGVVKYLPSLTPWPVRQRGARDTGSRREGTARIHGRDVLSKF